MQKHQIIFENQIIQYELIIKKVKNINLKVKPDQTITVSANKRVPVEYINSFVKKKAPWILKHLNYFKDNYSSEINKEYVSGESVKYLGRQYILKVEQSSENRVKFYRDYIYILASDINNYKLKEKLFNEWLNQMCNVVFKESIDRIHSKLEKYNIPKPDFKVRTMKSRWGSCMIYSNRITLNQHLIKAPKHCIDYVVLHELIHFKFKNHDKRFYNFMTSIMPDWKERKKVLEEEVLIV